MSLKIYTYYNSKVIYGPDSRYQVLEVVRDIKPYKTCVLTDGNIATLYSDYIRWLDNELEIEDTLVIEPGEKSKNIETVITLWRSLFERGLTRKSLIIGIGGGVVLDITGFIASTYMRGIDYISIPTTLLAQADSALGGKTGIDFIIKNGIGTFYPPRYTFIDPVFLETLPINEVKSGLAEIIKHSIIRGGEFYELVAENSLETIEDDKELFGKFLELSIETKVDIINKDLHERGLRRLLNLGHTVGHAIEKLSSYRLPHGYAVSIGIALESRISREILGFKYDDEVVNILESYGLPTEYNYDVEELVHEMKMDKKNWHGKIVMTLIEDIGRCKPVELDDDDIYRVLRRN